MVEGARLESVYTATYRGFESLPLRHKQQSPLFAGFVVYGGHAKLEKRMMFPLLTMFLLLSGCAAGPTSASGSTQDCRVVTNPDGSVRQVMRR